jgi:hypothetical protein
MLYAEFVDNAPIQRSSAAIRRVNFEEKTAVSRQSSRQALFLYLQRIEPKYYADHYAPTKAAVARFTTWSQPTRFRLSQSPGDFIGCDGARARSNVPQNE